MNIKSSATTILIALSLAGLVNADMTPPSGTITSPTFSGSNGLYDLTGIITNIDEDFTGSGGTTIGVGQGVNFTQTITGAFSGSGSTTGTVVLGNTPYPFLETYTVKGAVKTAGTNVALTLVFSGKGSGEFAGVERSLHEAITYMITIDPVTGTTTGRKSGSASASGEGTAKLPVTAITGTVPEGLPVNWSLSLTLTTTGTKVAGTAVVNLANDRSFPFTVKGTYSATTGSKLSLTGTGAGKGGKLTVELSDSTITSVTGGLLGQTVNITGL